MGLSTAFDASMVLLLNNVASGAITCLPCRSRTLPSHKETNRFCFDPKLVEPEYAVAFVQVRAAQFMWLAAT